MNKYEIMFIVKTDIDEKTQKDTVKAFEKVLTDMKSKVVNTKDMGQKKLAYPIKKELNGSTKKTPIMERQISMSPSLNETTFYTQSNPSLNLMERMNNLETYYKK